MWIALFCLLHSLQPFPVVRPSIPEPPAGLASVWAVARGTALLTLGWLWWLLSLGLWLRYGSPDLSLTSRNLVAWLALAIAVTGALRFFLQLENKSHIFGLTCVSGHMFDLTSHSCHAWHE